MTPLKGLLQLIFSAIDWFFKKATVLLRIIWYLFPAFFFLTVGYMCFWVLSQGQDVLIAAIEKKFANWTVLLALVFWVLVTWYTGRILIYHYPGIYNASRTLAHHAPRMMGFLIFGIAWISLLQVPELPNHHFTYHLSKKWAYALLLLHIPFYIVLYRLFKGWRVNYLKENDRVMPLKEIEFQRKWILKWVFNVLRLMLLVIVFFNYLWDDGTLLVLSFIILQVMFLFAVVWRRGALQFELLPMKYDGTRSQWMEHERTYHKRDSIIESLLGKIMPEFVKKGCYSILYYCNISFKERGFFLFFNFVSMIALFCYLLAIVKMPFANQMGTYPFIMLAFGVLVGFFALVSTLSVIRKINFHVILFLVVLLMGKAREPHYARTYTAPTTADLQRRPAIKDYFLKWAADRKDSILAAPRYPVFFVLSDGGASRSGYWTAAALGKIEDATGGGFSRHLFCLSGTSGGGVGVGSFFALLDNREEMKTRSYEKEAMAFLKNDYLTYTLTRMLGPDFFRPLLPFNLHKVSDRAGALEKSMEIGMDDSVFLKHKLIKPFSSFIPNLQQPIALPLLCINTTRMQDGRPGVITNFNLKGNADLFNKRVDLISLLGKDADLHLSTVLVMGARFPYISPAGRIDETIKKDSVKAHYFVDGGYFDNSGAGVVNEMIIEMRRLTDSLVANTTDTSYAYLKKLDYYIIHATNSPIGDPRIEKVHYMRNDLMAPVLTIVGAYGTQTDVNNLRLKKYLQSIYGKNEEHYKNIDLYHRVSSDTLSFPMNWTISDYYQQRMNRQLDTSKQVINTIEWLKQITRK
jgi:predicted acylesterase/phospholipase RssA